MGDSLMLLPILSEGLSEHQVTEYKYLGRRHRGLLIGPEM